MTKTKKNKFFFKIAKWVSEHGGGPVIPYSAEYEKRLSDTYGVEPEARKKGADEEGIASCINKIIKVGYTTLQLVHFFTAGEDEVKCWTVRGGYRSETVAG